jgi:hypothetical protein
MLQRVRSTRDASIVNMHQGRVKGIFLVEVRFYANRSALALRFCQCKAILVRICTQNSNKSHVTLRISPRCDSLSTLDESKEVCRDRLHPNCPSGLNSGTSHHDGVSVTRTSGDHLIC